MMKNKKMLILPVLILAVAVVLILALCSGEEPEVPVDPTGTAGRPSQAETVGPNVQTVSPEQTTGPAEETDPSREPTSDPAPTDPDRETDDDPKPLPEVQDPVTPEEPVVLEEGLCIERIGSYTGMYVEDGSGEIVTDIMMIVLRNRSEADLQLARIELVMEEEVYSFECTNLPAGEAVVLLEKDRRTAVEARPDQAQITLMVFFDSPMEQTSELLRIDGQRGMLTVTNVSGQDITDDIYVYYKFYEAGYYYGGITFRVAIRGGLASGASSQTIAGHYDPDSCQIVQVTHGA